jgi:hypothetical protein
MVAILSTWLLVVAVTVVQVFTQTLVVAVVETVLLPQRELWQ